VARSERDFDLRSNGHWGAADAPVLPVESRPMASALDAKQKRNLSGVNDCERIERAIAIEKLNDERVTLSGQSPSMRTHRIAASLTGREAMWNRRNDQPCPISNM
jgi:hypothetical protein